LRIANLSISNFKAIRTLELADLRDTVVVAGPNGCGKSCVFDAIRLLKSAYGGYQANEWQSWMGEQAINLSRNKTDSLRVLQDRTRPLRVAADFILSDTEIGYLTENALSICRDHLWREQTQQHGLPSFTASAQSVAASMRTYRPKAEADAQAMSAELVGELQKPVQAGALTIDPAGEITALRSIPLEVIFSRYDPQNIGIIDYHSSTRNYGRQQVDNVNLNIDTSNNHLKQHALYNASNKYSNLKTEMASSYIRQLLIDKAVGEKTSASLSETLDELFKTFFPGKKFLGPQPTPAGQLLFHVRLPNGAEHDIDELSAGEKEVLYGYLRLRNSTPQNSMILIDEPELHLNPRLISGLAGFYHKHLSRAMSNQLWLVTHSDTLIREAVENKDFSVFHMQPAAQADIGNQAARVQIREDVDRLLIDLIGDLAAYRPAAKMVLFEGGGDSDFDVRVVSTLFPDFARQTNCISAGNKRRVSQLYELLESSRLAGHIPGRFYAITDSDEDASGLKSPAATWRWAAYHIENYLLEPRFILKVLDDLGLASRFGGDPATVLTALKTSAERTVPTLVRHKLQNDANHTLQRAAELRLDRTKQDVASALTESLERTLARVQADIAAKLSRDLLQQAGNAVEQTARTQLESGEWLERFRGRDVLRTFVGEFGGGLPYESFRDLILARMRDATYQPQGMASVLAAILDDQPSSVPRR
jgi:predicted ATPase